MLFCSDGERSGGLMEGGLGGDENHGMRRGTNRRILEV